MIGCLRCALAEVRVGSETKFGYEYSEEKDENGEVTKEWAELTDSINNLKKIIEEDKLTVNRINGADSETLYSIESFTKNEDGTGFDGATVTIGSDSYSTVNGENTDTFNLQNELDFSKNYEYDSDNRIINTTISALSLAYDYDDESVGSLSYSLAQGATKSFSYQYDENGNIVSEQVTVDGVSADITAYEYDEDNQLVSAENGSTKWTYSYDNRGNLTAENEYTVSLNESGEKVYTPKENGADSYTYDTAWKDKLTSYNGQTISYDESGTPTSYLGHSLSWTMGRQLASYDNIAYSYNESGIRTSKTVGENTTEFYLNGTNIIYQTDGTNDIYFFYDRNNEIVGFKYENSNYFYVKNQMGDITDIANSNGEVVASYSYDPWGSVLSVTGSDITVGSLNPFRYRSYYYDSDIQMYYLQSRYYDPEVGRFINCDDVNYIGLTESEISYNPFAYCENEPVNYSDFSGCIYEKSGTRTNNKDFNVSVFRNSEFAVFFKNASYSDISKTLLLRGPGNKFDKPCTLSNYHIYERIYFCNYFDTKQTKSGFRYRYVSEYMFMSYQDWMFRISVENRNIIRRYKRYFKNIFKTGNTDFDEFIDLLKECAVESINSCIGAVYPNYKKYKEFADMIIDVSEIIIDYLCLKISKESKYIIDTFSKLKNCYKNDKYVIYVLHETRYERGLIYGGRGGRVASWSVCSRHSKW